MKKIIINMMLNVRRFLGAPLTSDWCRKCQRPLYVGEDSPPYLCAFCLRHAIFDLKQSSNIKIGALRKRLDSASTQLDRILMKVECEGNRHGLMRLVLQSCDKIRTEMEPDYTGHEQKLWDRYKNGDLLTHDGESVITKTRSLITQSGDER